MLNVTEIFRSLQGESTWAGLPFVFIRLAGCDLECAWCDTPYAHEGGEWMTVDEAVLKIESYQISRVCVTGGEPLLQAETPELITRLLRTGKTVLVETNGASAIDRVPDGAIRIMDIKCPGSGAAERFDWDNTRRLNERDEVKFVLADRNDYLYAREVIGRENLVRRCGAVLLSVVFGRLEPADVARWMLEDGLEARLQLQAHKIIWAPERRGV